MLANDEYIKVISRITKQKETDIKESLQKDSTDFQYNNDIKIVLSTTGMNNTPIAL